MKWPLFGYGMNGRLTDMYDSFWRSQVVKYKAVRVKFGMLRQGHGRDPKPNDVPDKVIWFETLNFGWILSAKKENGKRSILLKY